MKTSEAIIFLERHQPMPSDFLITKEEGAIYAAVLKHFEDQPDSRSIPLLLGSVSEATGLGMYEHIKFVLLKHRKEEVVPHLRVAFKTGAAAVKTRCCWWACDIKAWDLEDQIGSALSSEDEDLRDAASAFFELKTEPNQTSEPTAPSGRGSP